ncbi:unnamed protein product [Trichobilharzia regenti]|nr:unnamed protein product [Trichobilharzia regenti]
MQIVVSSVGVGLRFYIFRFHPTNIDFGRVGIIYGTYFKQLAEDYLSSGRDTLQLIRKNPIQVPDFVRNSKSACYVHRCLQLYFKEQLRYSNFGLFTVCNYTYPANGGGNFTSLIRLFLFDRPQEKGWLRIRNIVNDRILDFGFMGKWWLMSHYMEDYDVNPDEWENGTQFT